MLNMIDHLPRNSYYSEAVSNDPEHARALVELQAKHGQDPKKYRPPMATWTPEVDMLAKAVDALRRVEYAVQSTVASKGSSIPQPKYEPRPRTAFEQAQHESRKSKHDSLVARVLPHKAKPKG